MWEFFPLGQPPPPLQCIQAQKLFGPKKKSVLTESQNYGQAAPTSLLDVQIQHSQEKGKWSAIGAKRQALNNRKKMTFKLPNGPNLCVNIQVKRERGFRVKSKFYTKRRFMTVSTQIWHGKCFIIVSICRRAFQHKNLRTNIVPGNCLCPSPPILKCKYTNLPTCSFRQHQIY